MRNTARTTPSRNENRSFETTAASSWPAERRKIAPEALAKCRSQHHPRSDEQVEETEQGGRSAGEER